MTQDYILKNAKVINEGKITDSDIYISEGYIQRIAKSIDIPGVEVLDIRGKCLLPGIIDCQVHFRDPGFTEKADMLTESRAAIAGGVTSFIDMPNTVPMVLDVKDIQRKNEIASKKSLANYGFFMGVTNENIDKLLNIDTSEFFAVSDDGLYFAKRGNLIVDNPELMDKLFANCKTIVAIHSEDEDIIEKNEKYYRNLYGDNVPINLHPIIRSEEACYTSTKRAIELARKYGIRLHILHLSTELEAELFDNSIPLVDKKITTEVCVQHLWFSDKDYEKLGTRIKWNPAIKTDRDRIGLMRALLDDRIDIITTDHAPHLWEEKDQPYFQAKSGAPIVQHSLSIMWELYRQGTIPLEKIVEKMCHNPAILYGIEKRGFIREGYYADLVIVDPDSQWTVGEDNILFKCGWSPLTGTTFHSRVTHTFVNGNLVYLNGDFRDQFRGLPLKKIPNSSRI